MLYWKQSSVENPARVGEGYGVETLWWNFKLLIPTNNISRVTQAREKLNNFDTITLVS